MTVVDVGTHVVPATLEQLRGAAHELRVAASIGDVLYWDDRVHRPVAAGAWRSVQREWLAGQLHACSTSPRLETVIDAAEQEVGPDDLEVRAMRRDFRRARLLPAGFTGRFEAAASHARAAWDDARRRSDYAVFEPHLARMCDLARESAEHLGYEHEPYDALLETWEPGADAAWVSGIFDELHERLVPLLAHRPHGAREVVLRPLTDGARHAVEQEVLEAVGFDDQRGRIVPSSRAFCIALGPDDVRMTTRFHETPWLKGIHSTLHEAGHATYAQAFARLGVPATLAAAPGLGLDESQSRLVENVIGRGRAFSEWLLGRLMHHAPEAYGSADELDLLYRDMNVAEHPCRRLGTDELSYNLHVLIRFRLERAMVNGELEAAALPEAWSDAMQSTLGVRPGSDTDGCLQDVHWSLGQWGYFPTYTLGNVYCMQLMQAARAEVADIDGEIARTGGSPSLRAWLDDRVLRHGRRHTGRELVELVTGRAVAVDALVDYLDDKFVRRAAEFPHD